MKRLSKLTLLFAAVVMLMEAFLPVVSLAVLIGEGTKYNEQSVVSLNKTDVRPYSDDNGNGNIDDTYNFYLSGIQQNSVVNQVPYKIGDFNQTDGFNFNRDYLYYCLNWGIGFGSSNPDYTIPANGVDYVFVKNLKDYTVEDSNGAIANATDLNKIRWIADKMYVPNLDSSNTTYDAAQLKAKLLADAGITNSTLTEDDIDVIQQFALWYMINDKADELYPDRLGESLYAKLHVQGFDFGNGFIRVNDSNLSGDRASDANKLFNYFTKSEETYTEDEPEIKINSTEKGYTGELSIQEVRKNPFNVLVIGPFRIDEMNSNNNYFDFSYEIEYKTSEDEANYTILNTENTFYYVLDNPDSSLSFGGNGNLNYDIAEKINDGEFYIGIIKNDEDYTNATNNNPLAQQNYKTNVTNIADFKLSVDYNYYDTLATVWVAEENRNDSQPVLKVEKVKVSDSDYARVGVITPKFDLSLRKFISDIERAGAKVTFDSREPVVDTTNLRNREPGDEVATAKYTHSKEVLTLKRGDLITYTIRIYNEADVDGTATAVTDYLPEGLVFVPNNQTNITYGWSANGQAVSTTYLADNNIVLPAYEKDGRGERATGDIHWLTNGDDCLYYIDLPIVCRIDDSVSAGVELRNIAAITGYSDEDGDSDTTDFDKGDGYNPPTDNSTYLEDDDDYEIVKVEEIFDLSLRKYISSVSTNGETTTFEEDGERKPNDVTTNLNKGDVTTADYKHRKDPVEVETGSLVNYKLVIYNEGDIAGRATKVIDQLPEGLIFKNVVSGNFVLDEYDETNNRVTLEREDRNEDNLAPYANGTLSFEVIEIQCEVTADPDETNNTVLTNIAWIAEYYNSENIPDRDSAPERITVPAELVTTDDGYINEEDNSGKDLADKTNYFIGQEDDDDFEKVVIKPQIGYYDIVLVKEDSQGEQLSETATFEVDGVTKQVTGRLTIVKDKVISASNVDEVDTYIIRETVPPDEYCAFDGTIKIEVYKKKSGRRYVVDSIKYYVDNVEVVEDRNDLDVYLNTNGNIYVEVKDYQFDLSLRKYIDKIERRGEQVELEEPRAPRIDTLALKNRGSTTATYKHTKDVVSVKHGDIVTYKIRVYNEGELDGKVTKITDYLPEGLALIAVVSPDYNGELNKNWQIVTNQGIKSMPLVGENGWYKDESEIPENSILKNEDVENLNLVWAEGNNLLEIENNSLNDTVIKKYGSTVEEGDNWQKSIQDENDGLFYEEVEVICMVVAPNTYEGTLKNVAEISDHQAINNNNVEVDVADRDSEPYNVYEDDVHTPGMEINEYTPGEQDDDDFEPLKLTYFDLALRKFITGVNEEEVNSRIPEFYIDEEGNYKYKHPKDPVYVVDKDIVTYTIRVFNEGTIAGYAEEVEDDIPEGLLFLPESDLNIGYRWVMYREALEDEDLEGKTTITRNNKIYVETQNAEEATIIRTDYLSEAQGTINEETGENSNLLKPFDKATMDSPDYRDIQVQFKVMQEEIPEDNEGRIIINKAQITEDSDDDEDSIPDKWNEGEDDQDIEKIYVQEFDLALFKWVSKTIVTVDGKTTETETGFIPNVGLTEVTGENYRDNEEPEPIAKVELDKKKLKSTVVKFVYNIRVRNEGDIPGYATEIVDYIPEGLEFIAEDNKYWGWELGEKEGTIKTRALETILIQPGATVELSVVFTWKNDSNNLGLKTNVAVISEDYNDKHVKDIDSTPGNEDMTKYDKEQEDDDDFALVILTLKTGTEVKYIGLVLGFVTIIAAGAITIKKFVL